VSEVEILEASVCPVCLWALQNIYKAKYIHQVLKLPCTPKFHKVGVARPHSVRASHYYGGHRAGRHVF